MAEVSRQLNFSLCRIYTVAELQELITKNNMFYLRNVVDVTGVFLKLINKQHKRSVSLLACLRANA